MIPSNTTWRLARVSNGESLSLSLFACTPSPLLASSAVVLEKNCRSTLAVEESEKARERERLTLLMGCTSLHFG